MYRYHALGGASLAVLGSALALMPSTAGAQTALPAVTVEAPRAAAARPAARKPAVRSSARTQGAAAFGQPRAISIADRGHHPERGARCFTRRPLARPRRPSTAASSKPAGVLRGRRAAREPRHLGEAGQRAARYRHLDPRLQRPQRFGIRNLVIFDDGFPVTQPDGLSRSDLIDPKAYAAIDDPGAVVGALWQLCDRRRAEFPHPPGPHHRRGRIRRGRQFGYLNNYLAAGKKVGNFEYSLFASDARGDGFIGNSWFNTQTVNFLGTLHATPDDRFTVKFINNNLDTTSAPVHARPVLPESVPARLHDGRSLARMCNGAIVQQRLQRPEQHPTRLQAGLGRTDRRTIVGGRWEHDFDNTTTWRNQFVFDDRNISQPTGHQRDRRFSVLQLHE